LVYLEIFILLTVRESQKKKSYICPFVLLEGKAANKEMFIEVSGFTAGILIQSAVLQN
jgi:hypothetical protein